MTTEAMCLVGSSCIAATKENEGRLMARDSSFPATVLTNVGPGVRVDEEQFGPLESARL